MVDFSEQCSHTPTAIDYRLSPQYVFPCALQDMISAYLYLIDPPKGQRKYLPSQVVLVGDSAGGNLALATLLWLRDSNWPMPSGIILMSPWMDLSHSTPSFSLNTPFDYLPDKSIDPKYIHDSRKHYCLTDNSFLHYPLVSPMYADEVEEKPLPPILIHIGDAEKLRDETLVFFSRFSSTRIQVEMYQDMIHVFQLARSCFVFEFVQS